MAPRAPRATKEKAFAAAAVAIDAASVSSAQTSAYTPPSPPPTALKPVTAKSKVEKTTKPKATKASTAAKTEKVEKAIKNGDAKVIVKKDGGTGKKDGAGGKGEKEDDKVKKVTGEEAELLIREYLREQNRPYSSTEVVANLRGKVAKTVADKLLKEMEQAGQIMGKATNGDKKGSQWVFWCSQDPKDSATPEELATMDIHITTLRETTLPPLKIHLKSFHTKLTSILSTPTTSDLSVLVSNLQSSNAEKKEKLKVFKEGGVRMISKEEKDKVEKEWKYWKSKREGRRKMFGDLEAMLLEGMGKEELWDKVGIEDGDVDL
ncbi:Tat binding protein 1-interacting protein-domain-containing protein [Halenospora varia]|nr:Tat binding protein 1-interacting protein-domain-containing protein [Halenospora varia]